MLTSLSSFLVVLLEKVAELRAGLHLGSLMCCSPATTEGFVQQGDLHRSAKSALLVVSFITPAPNALARCQLLCEDLLQLILQAHHGCLPFQKFCLVLLWCRAPTQASRAHIRFVVTAWSYRAWAARRILTWWPSTWSRLRNGLCHDLHLLRVDLKCILIARALQVPEHPLRGVCHCCSLAAARATSKNMRHFQEGEFHSSTANCLKS
mmetsp:Transcript_74006/g.130732  ORF Transcript_74006/g.130732 Transcript_74006/m.130732 type:complete len:208 (-) Transcript_74006:830-1453(-)